MDGHTVSEVYLDNYGWVLVDTYGNLMFVTQNGSLVSVLTASNHCNQIIPVRILEKKVDPFGVDYMKEKNIIERVYCEQHLFVVVEGKYLFDFHNYIRNPKYLVRFLLSTRYGIKAVQYIGKNCDYKVGNTGLARLMILLKKLMKMP